ncbi:MAG: hypothetical protein H0U46_04495 [Actinobacteria bacterium]|nr:hypothetical protein [Actinomycetota bacterium]
MADEQLIGQSGEVFRALDKVVEACTTTRNDDVVFAVAAWAFLDQFNAFPGRARRHAGPSAPLATFLDSDSLVPLAAFRDSLRADRELDRAAAVGVVHDFIIWCRQEIARLN